MKIQNKIYSTLIVFVLALLILIVFLIYPTLRDIKNSYKEILSDKEKTALLYLQSKELDDFKKTSKDYKSNLEKLDQLFIDPKNPVDFIKFLEKISSDLNIEVDINLSSKTREASENPPFSSFQIYTKGDFQNVLKFSEKLETSPYLVKINSLSINKLIEDNEKATKTSNMVGANFLIEVLNKQSY